MIGILKKILKRRINRISGKNDDVVQMKGSGQYLCGNACDEDEEDEY